MVDVHFHGNVIENCSEACEASGHGTCVWHNVSERFICACNGQWTRDNMHFINPPLACPVPMLSQQVFSCVHLLGSCYIAAWAIRFARAFPRDRKLGIIFFVSAVSHALYDIMRIVTVNESAIGAISFAFICISCVNCARTVILELAQEAHELVHDSAEQLEHFILVHSRLAAWVDAVVDTVSSLMVVARLFGTSALNSDDILGYNQNTRINIWLLTVAEIVLAISFQVFLSRIRMILSMNNGASATSEMGMFLLRSIKKYRDLMVVAAGNICVCSTILGYRYKQSNENLENVWILFAYVQSRSLAQLTLWRGPIVELAELRSKKDSASTGLGRITSGHFSVLRH